jgi:hypothetical protein
MSWFFSSKYNNSSSSSSQAPPNETDVLASAEATLSAGGLPLSLLPELNDNEAWKELKDTYKLSFPQMQALKKYKSQQAPTKPAVSTTKSQPEVVEEDFSLSPAAALMNCLRYIPDKTLLQTLIGPGNCLFDMLPAVEPATGVGVTKELIADVLKTHRESLGKLALRPNINEEQLLAVRMYTVKLPIPFYAYVNKVLNSPNRDGIASIAPYMRLLIKGLYAMDECGYGVTAQAYRGVNIGTSTALQAKFDAHETVFAPKSLITFAAFTSVTRVSAEAEGFGDFFFFHLLSVRGVDISTVSEYPDEAELLVIPPAVFRVGGACKLHGKLTVPLTHVAQEDASYLSKLELKATVSISKEVRC